MWLPVHRITTWMYRCLCAVYTESTERVRENELRKSISAAEADDGDDAFNNAQSTSLYL